MSATRVFESLVQAPILCGLLRAYCFTAPAARRSELPSRSTGLTALPSTLPERARISFSACVAVRIVRHVVTLALQLLDRSLQLRDRGGDVGQLYDVGLGACRKLAKFGELVVDLLRWRQFVGEVGDDPA